MPALEKLPKRVSGIRKTAGRKGIGAEQIRGFVLNVFMRAGEPRQKSASDADGNQDDRDDAGGAMPPCDMGVKQQPLKPRVEH